MAYLIETFDKPGALPLRLAVRDKPLAYLEENKESLIACGAKLDDDGENAMEASTWWILKPGHKQRTS
jgi:uncharacterized protein YciI